MIDESYLHKVLRSLVHDLKGSLGTSAGLADLLKNKYHDKLDAKAIEWLNMIALEYATSQSKLVGLSAYAKLINYTPKLSKVNLSSFIASWHKAFKHGRLNTLTSPQLYQLDIDAENIANANQDCLTDTHLLGLFLDEVMVNAICHAKPFEYRNDQIALGTDNPKARTLNCQLSIATSDTHYTLRFKDNGLALQDSELDFIQAPFTSLQHSFTKSVSHAKTAGMGFSRLFRIAELLNASLHIGIGTKPYPGLWVELKAKL